MISGIQTFKYRRRRITVIFWNGKIWFNAYEIYEILGYKGSLIKLMHLVDAKDRFTKSNGRTSEGELRPSIRLISENGLYVYTYHKVLKPKQREKAQELFDFVQAEIVPIFDEYIRSWL